MKLQSGRIKNFANTGGKGEDDEFIMKVSLEVTVEI